jgi:S-adenosylmethionine hydrolase
MNKPVSPIFHGRDVFAPAAAHLSNGVDISAFGPKINPKKLVKAPYAEADIKKTRITAMALSINRFGNVFMNIIFNEMKKKSGIRLNDNIKIMTSAHDIDAKFVKAFGEVGKNEPAMMPDDFGRIELAINQGDFADRYGVRQGERIDILKS